MLTLLNTCHDIIGIFDFMERVLLGLTDKFDIKILSHLTLVQLSNLFPSAVLQSKLPSFFVLLLFAFLAPPKFLCVCKSIEIEDFVAPLEVTINTKMKDTAVKQEIEKNEELVRSSLRGVVALSRLPESGSNPFFSFTCERLGVVFFFFAHSTCSQTPTLDSRLFSRHSRPQSTMPSWTQSSQRPKRGTVALTRWTPLKQPTT